MDRAQVLLQAFQHRLKNHLPFMTRATKAQVEFVPRSGGEFAIVARWKNRDGADGQFIQEYNKAYCLGATLSLSPEAWLVQGRACDHARDLVRCVLAARGVL